MPVKTESGLICTRGNVFLDRVVPLCSLCGHWFFDLFVCLSNHVSIYLSFVYLMSIRQGLHYPKKDGSIHSHPRKECSRNHILSKKSLTIRQKLWLFKGEPSATSSFAVSKTILFWYQTCKKPGWKSGLFHSSVGIYILSKGVPSSTISWSKSKGDIRRPGTASCLKTQGFLQLILIIPQHYDRKTVGNQVQSI